MRNQPRIMFVRLFFGKFERETKLLFGFRPIAVLNQAKPACVGTFQKSFAVFGNQFFGFFQILKRRYALVFTPRQTRQRM